MPTGRLPAPPFPFQIPILTDFFPHISKLNKTIFSVGLAALEQHQDSGAWTAQHWLSEQGPAKRQKRGSSVPPMFGPELNSLTHSPQAHTPTPEGRTDEGELSLSTHLASLTAIACAYGSLTQGVGDCGAKARVLLQSPPRHVPKHLFTTSKAEGALALQEAKLTVAPTALPFST